MVFEELTSFWKATKQAYVSGDIKKVMYYYLTFCIIVVYGVYLYIYYRGFVGMTAIVNIWFLNRPSDIPFTLLDAVGIVFILRYGFMNAIDGLKQKPPQNLENRLKAVEGKMDRLYKMAVEPDYDPKKHEEESK
jgi:hypothetical protein